MRITQSSFRRIIGMRIGAVCFLLNGTVGRRAEAQGIEAVQDNENEIGL
jgi:hypothetical protein